MPNIPLPRDIPTSVQDLRNEFDRWLDRLWHSGWTTSPLDGQDWAPRLDVVDEEDRYRVRAEVPGLSAEDVEVSILDSVLTIKGEKPSARKPGDDENFLRTECRYGSFCRTFQLPTEVRDDAVQATCKNGVLLIEIPKANVTKGHKVTIDFQD